MFLGNEHSPDIEFQVILPGVVVRVEVMGGPVGNK